jgi:NADPH:quinone reductase-like Zn-dependent oxidoreductase
MKVITLPRYGGAEVLTIAQARKPEPGPDQILVRVRAIGRFSDTWLPLLSAGTIEPVIHAAVPFSEAARVHEIMEANENLGKVIITIG